MSSTILIVTTSRWFTTARLAMAFSQLDCNVDAICPPGNALLKTKAVRRTYRYRAFSPLDCFYKAIQTSKPNLIVAGDDLASTHLQDLLLREQHRGEAGKMLCDLIERSIGPSTSFPYFRTRASFMQLGAELGIRSPKTTALVGDRDLEYWISRMGMPTVLKADGTSSGEGVKIVHSLPEARSALRTLSAPPEWIRVAKRAIVNGDLKWIRPALTRRRAVVNAQEYIPGRDATSLIACWNGECLAALHFEVLNKQYSNGPASVLRLIQNEEITFATTKLARRLNLSGLHGFDFLLERDTDKAYLIEMNPRATQVGHLALGQGRDLPAALVAAASGEAVPETHRITDNHDRGSFPSRMAPKLAKHIPHLGVSRYSLGGTGSDSRMFAPIP